MRKIQIKDYVSNDTLANATITNFDNNKLVIKGDTGIGGTTSILNITNRNIIIISPLSGMIIAKEHKRQPHQMFIYQDSKDRWQHYEKEIKYGENIILNTTPEQIIEVRKNSIELFNRIMHIPFFVDESQVYSESDYRKTLNEFFDILLNHHKGNFTLSTATPTHNNLDIPSHVLKNMEFLSIERLERRPKPITISPLKNYYNFIKSHCDKGNKVVLFTNDIQKIKNILKDDDFGYRTQLLVGDTLAVKTSAIKTKSLKEYNLLDKSKVDVDADLYILSTKYLIGFDLEFDASVGIIMDETSIVDDFNVNQVVQAYGRIRKNVIEASIFYKYKIKTKSDENQSIQQIQNNILATEFNSEYLTNIQPLIGNLNNSLSYPQVSLIESLKGYGFDVNIEQQEYEPSTITVNFADNYRNLINQEDKDPYFLQKEFVKVYSKMKGDDLNYNGYSQKQLLLWASAYIAVVTDSDYLMNYVPERYDRLLIRTKTFIDVNDLAYPHKMTDLDKITKFRVSDHTIKIAQKEGALCEVIKTSQIEKKPDNNLEFVDVLEETKYTKNSNLYYDDTFNKAKQIINSLYCIHLVEDGKYSKETERIIHGFSVVSECIISDYVKSLTEISGKNIKSLLENDDKEELEKITKDHAHQLKISETFKNNTRKIKEKLEKLKGYEEYNQGEIDQIMNKATAIKSSLIQCKRGVRNTIKMNTYSLDSQVERHKYYVLSLLSLSCAGHMFGFKTTSRDNRIFNTATKTTRQLRPYVPYELIQCDIKSAFATFLDEMVGSDISQDVYVNIMQNEDIDRSQAKTRFNSMLNDFKRSPKEARAFFKSCGYSPEQVEKILSITTKEKGSFYREMTKKEEDIIRDFKEMNRLDETAIRLHDAIFIPNLPKYRNLTSKIGRCEFEIKLI